MATATYRGFILKTAGSCADVWQVQIKNHVLSGSMPAVKKSIDWFFDTSKIIDPKEFSPLENKKQAERNPSQENFHGYIIKNDTGDPNSWYCFFNGKLIKGGKPSIQKHIEAYLLPEKRKQFNIHYSRERRRLCNSSSGKRSKQNGLPSLWTRLSRVLKYFL